MKIAFLDHSYHKKTKSTSFLADILQKNNHEIEYIWDEAWCGGKSVVFDDIVGKYDAFVFFQSIPTSSEPFYKTGANITFIPMLDSFGSEYSFHKKYGILSNWESFYGCKVLCFSKYLANVYLSNGIAAKHFKYYPNPDEFKTNFNIENKKGFFWPRRPDQINWRMIKQIVEKASIDSMHVHLVEDPGVEKDVVSVEEMEKFNVTVSNWSEDKNVYIKAVEESSMFFAPRFCEGIGMSFLEAMAMGKCVIAPNVGTMNEYITSGLNGVLYDINHDKSIKTIPESISFDVCSVQEMCRNAKKSIELGYNYWLSKEKEIVEFIIENPKLIYEMSFQLMMEPPLVATIQTQASQGSSSFYKKIKHKLKKYKAIRYIHALLIKRDR